MIRLFGLLPTAAAKLRSTRLRGNRTAATDIPVAPMVVDV